MFSMQEAYPQYAIFNNGIPSLSATNLFGGINIKGSSMGRGVQ